MKRKAEQISTRKDKEQKPAIENVRIDDGKLRFKRKRKEENPTTSESTGAPTRAHHKGSNGERTTHSSDKSSAKQTNTHSSKHQKVKQAAERQGHKRKREEPAAEAAKNVHSHAKKKSKKTNTAHEKKSTIDKKLDRKEAELDPEIIRLDKACNNIHRADQKKTEYVEQSSKSKERGENKDVMEELINIEKKTITNINQRIIAYYKNINWEFLTEYYSKLLQHSSKENPLDEYDTYAIWFYNYTMLLVAGIYSDYALIDKRDDEESQINGYFNESEKLYKFINSHNNKLIFDQTVDKDLVDMLLIQKSDAWFYSSNIVFDRADRDLTKVQTQAFDQKVYESLKAARDSFAEILKKLPKVKHEVYNYTHHMGKIEEFDQKLETYVNGVTTDEEILSEGEPEPVEQKQVGLERKPNNPPKMKKGHAEKHGFFTRKSTSASIESVETESFNWGPPFNPSLSWETPFAAPKCTEKESLELPERQQSFMSVFDDLLPLYTNTKEEEEKNIEANGIEEEEDELLQLLEDLPNLQY